MKGKGDKRIDKKIDQLKRMSDKVIRFIEKRIQVSSSDLMKKRQNGC